MKDIIEKEFNEHIRVASSIYNLTDDIAASAQLCINSLNSSGKILILGNGGSAADAQHIAAELVGRYKVERKGLPAIALTTDTSALTSIANDYGYLHVIDRQVEALANKGDIVIGISTSGTSKNVISALKIASELNCKTIGFSGKESALLSEICDINLAIESQDTARIQEMHILIGHIICNLIDQEFKN